MNAGLKITEGILNYPLEMGKIIVITSFTINLIMKKAQDFKIDLAEMAISLIKFLGYGALALFIFANTSELEEIDVLTYFTFLLACIESAHNLANSIVLWGVGLIKVLLKNIW